MSTPFGPSGVNRELAARICDALPAGDAWHTEWLRRVSAPFEGPCPSVLGEDSLAELDEIRRIAGWRFSALAVPGTGWQESSIARGSRSR